MRSRFDESMEADETSCIPAIMNQADPFNLQRFLDAQSRCYDQVCRELRAGSKSSHWMWFIFPQWRGLGQSPTAIFYAIASRGEAQAYLAHSMLGPRLIECTRLVNAIEGRSVEDIFGFPNNLKFRSSVTLFADIATDEPVFLKALEKFFAGEPDPRTLDLMKH